MWGGQANGHLKAQHSESDQVKNRESNGISKIGWQVTLGKPKQRQGEHLGGEPYCWGGEINCPLAL